ncbi:MAG: putative toxin-antitoxin system toxin component, PIN family [Candidatus Methanoperedens sp.]|nr:putative toxin-antitoxin system toxin component, PIN family [Candidatus Methanoperedens sp.]
MKYRVFLDTNVFIYAYEFQESNSAEIIELLNDEKIEAVISERVLKEVYNYFRKFHNKNLADTFRRYLIETCTMILARDVKDSMDLYRGQIKEKDLEQLAVVKKYGIKYLIALDRDFNKFEEYRTPHEFIGLICEQGKESEF